jgi:hypothetical protein
MDKVGCRARLGPSPGKPSVESNPGRAGRARHCSEHNADTTRTCSITDFVLTRRRPWREGRARDKERGCSIHFVRLTHWPLILPVCDARFGPSAVDGIGRLLARIARGGGRDGHGQHRTGDGQSAQLQGLVGWGVWGMMRTTRGVQHETIWHGLAVRSSVKGPGPLVSLSRLSSHDVVA